MVLQQQRLVNVLVELADTLVDDFDIIEFLHTLSDRVVELLDADAAGVTLANQRGQLQLIASSTEEARLLELFELQNDEGPCLDCFREGRAVVNTSPDEASRRWPRFTQALRDAGFVSVHAIPLRLRGQIIGALNLFVSRGLLLNPDDVAVAQALSDVATIGILQERALRQREILAQQLQGALNSRIVIEQAKGVVAERHGVGIDQAFEAIRSFARRTNRPLSQVAAELIAGTLDTAELERG